MALTVLITGADGAQYRLGADEPDPAWVPFGIEWESVVPGGWKSASFSLRRRIDEDIPLRLLDEVEIIDEHGQIMYEGRIQKLPRQHRDDFLLQVECLGWAAHLLDDPSFCEIYIDQDLSRWGEPSRANRIGLVAANVTLGESGINPDVTNALPALRLGINGPWNGTAGFRSQAWYDAGDPDQTRIGAVYYDVVPNANVLAGVGDANWTWKVFGTDVDDGSAFPHSTAELRAASAAGYLSLTTARRWAMVQLGYTAAAGTGISYEIFWRRLAVYGDHGQVSVGPDPQGFYIDDILCHALAKAAPKINFSRGDGGSIQRPPLIVTQAAYPDPGPVENVVLDLNKYVLWDWLVYENRTLFYRPTDPDRLTWDARLDKGIHLSLEGDDAEHAYNGCLVRYSLPDGTRRFAGPPGHGFKVTSDLLADLDPDNTVNQHGYQRKWIEKEISFPIDDTNAVAIGAAYLAQASLPSRSGDITLKGEIEHPTKGLRPVREIRAGDWIRLSDHPADVPRRIISARHTDDDRTTTVSVGNDLDKVDAALEQLGVITKVRLG